MTDSETPTLLGFAQPVVAPLAEPTAERVLDRMKRFGE